MLLPGRRRLLVGLALVLTFLLAAGCGGDDDQHEEFASDVRASRDRTDAALAQITEATQFNELLERIRGASEEVDGAADDLAEADPPEDLEDNSEQLTAAYRALSEELLATADGLENQIDENTGPITGLEFENWERVQDALDGMRREGVQVEPLARHGG